MPCCTCLRSSYGYKATKVSKAKFVRMLNDNKEFAQYPVNFSAYTWNPEELDALCGALSATQYLTHLKYVAHRTQSRLVGAYRRRLLTWHVRFAQLDQLCVSRL